MSSDKKKRIEKELNKSLIDLSKAAQETKLFGLYGSSNFDKAGILLNLINTTFLHLIDFIYDDFDNHVFWLSSNTESDPDGKELGLSLKKQVSLFTNSLKECVSFYDLELKKTASSIKNKVNKLTNIYVELCESRRKAFDESRSKAFDESRSKASDESRSKAFIEHSKKNAKSEAEEKALSYIQSLVTVFDPTEIVTGGNG